MIKNPIPNNEAEYYANFNFMWKDALEQTQKHKAHLLVSVLSQSESKLDQAKLLLKYHLRVCKMSILWDFIQEELF